MPKHPQARRAQTRPSTPKHENNIFNWRDTVIDPKKWYEWFVFQQKVKLVLKVFNVCVKCIMKEYKWDVISKEIIVLYLEMSLYCAAIILSHDRRSINLRAHSMLKNHKNNNFFIEIIFKHNKTILKYAKT
jgi:hypothetical protein